MSEAAMKRIDKGMLRLKQAIEWIIFLLFIVVVLSGFVQVIGREFLHKSFIWSEELCRYAGVWLVMLGTAVLFGSDSHICLDYFLLKFPEKVRKCIMLVNYVVMIFTMGWFSYYTIVMIQGTGTTPSPALGVPMGIIYLCLVLCGIFSIVFLLYSAVKYYFYPKSEAEEEGGDTR